MFPWITQVRKKKIQTSANNVSMHPLWKAAWEVILKCTTEKRNATNATMLLLKQAIWVDIWKCTVEKSRTNATNVTMPLLGQAIWGHIWKRTTEKNQTKWHMESAESFEYSNIIYSEGSVDLNLRMWLYDGTGDSIVCLCEWEWETNRRSDKVLNLNSGPEFGTLSERLDKRNCVAVFLQFGQKHLAI